jgi:DNA polymerase epsilon subunit 1
MTWTWRGEYSPASMSDYQAVKRQLMYEKVDDKPFTELSEKAQSVLIYNRLKIYANRVYKKTKTVKVDERANTVCMRENPFYVNTVRSFRDRRYDYKLLTKQWKGKMNEADKTGDVIKKKVAEDKAVLMDSLQLAHKCILNSFYGYVMRKGARWKSMEMAGIVTHTGSNIITQARELVEQLGRPLELDTDGIWCILPSSFPQEAKLKTNKGKTIGVEYPCAMLNADVHARYTNHQYQDRVGTVAEKNFDTHNECSIYFELDGPYKAMILPASPEEGRLLKKKYAVYNFDGSLAELKGFEVKRRGELELIKTFQTEVFERFLDGNTIQECYQSVGDVANRWLDVLDEQGVNMNDEELMEYISERKTISKTFDEYGGRKATSLTTASRLGDFLGLEMLKDKGLNCQLVISRLPHGAPVTERAVPVAIFSAEPAIKRHWLRKWLKEPTINVDNFRDLIDWNYYKERLGNSIQKIISIPAGLQRVLNPCPRIIHPTWLTRQFNDNLSGLKQSKISNMFKSMNLLNAASSTSSENNNIFSKKKNLFESNFPLLKSQNKRDHNDISKDNLIENTSCNDDIGDIEDFGSKKSNSPPVPISHSKSKSSGISPVNLNNNTDEIVIIPAMSLEPVQNADELKEWITSRKKSWKLKRNEKKKELLSKNKNGQNHWDLNEETEANGKKKPVGVVDFVRNANLEAAYKVWQIVELQELDTPGDFIVWAMTSKIQIQRLKLTIPRYMYVNCNGSSAEESTLHLGGKKINHHLPHGRPNFNLYEVIVSEQKFQKNGKTLTEFLSNPQIEGVYETQSPLWFRGVMRLGCNARVISNRGNKNTDTISNYKLSDLETVNTSSHGYLSSNISVYRRIFLYYIHNKNGLGAVALFIFDSTNVTDEELYTTNQNGDNGINFDYLHIQSGKAFIWIASKGNNDKLPFQRIYRNFQPSEEGSMKFTSTFTRDINESIRACNERLSIYLRERHGPTIVIAQGLLEQRQWRKKFPLLNEFPLATMPANSTDDNFPSVGWQMFVANRIVQRSLLFSRWFEDRLKCARYAHIPVCNLGSNAPTTMIDIIFARQLQHNRHLLWASDGKMPDIGGAETDEHGAWSIPLSEPVINEPGVYKGVSVELDLYGLSICAILSSIALDSEGLISETTTGQSDSASSSYSSDTSCTRAFNLLKAVVTKWMHDMEVSANPISDSLLLNLYRYLCGYGESLLKDPSLHRVVYGLMTKLFKKLISEFKKLGVQVIYADFERIIVHTNKYDMESAKEYIEFITNAVINNDVFASLTISSKLYYEQLIWMGADNYGGILYNDENDMDDVNNFENEEEMYNDDVDQMHSYNEKNNANYDYDDDDGDDEDEGLVVNKSRVRFNFNNRSSEINDSEEDDYGINNKYNDLLGDGGDHSDGEEPHRLDDEELYGEQFSDENPYNKIEEEVNAEDKYLKSHWNMASFLPENAAAYFIAIIGMYIYLINFIILFII